jgi:hypothetical protein
MPVQIKTARVAIAVAWAVTIALGCTFIAGYWLSRGALGAAVTRAILFALIMTCLWMVGYKAYTHRGDSGRWFDAPVSVAYKRALRATIIQQVIAGVLALGQGQTRHAALVAALAYWLSVVIVVARRPTSPTLGDILFVKYGFLVVLLIVLTAGSVYWAWLGRW